jgi:hypothetical protein
MNGQRFGDHFNGCAAGKVLWAKSRLTDPAAGVITS